MEDINKNVNFKGSLVWTLEIMRIAGYWIPKSTDKSKALMYGLYSALVVSGTLLIHTCTEIAYAAFIVGALEEMIESLYFLLTHGMQCLKVFTFITKRHKIYKLLEDIEQHAHKPKNYRQLESALKIIRYTDKLAKILVSMVVVTVVFCTLSAVMDDPIAKQLPTRAWYPFNYKRSPFYEFLIVYQTVTIMLCGCANAAMDMAAAAFISQICIQLDILSDSLVHIKEFAELQTTATSVVADEDIVSPELQKAMRNFLIQCVQHHLKIKEYSSEVQGIFSFQLFSQFLTAVGTICMTLFEMTMVPFNSIYFWHLLVYQGCMLMEIAVFCWYGNEVIFKSRKLQTSLYNSDWVNCSEDYKKMLLLTMVNMRNELSVRVGGILTFSLETFVTVLRSAWSYYLVLDQVRQK